MERVLVTGGAGFIGSHLVERLVELGKEVVVVDDLSLGSISNLESVKDKVVLYQRSICDNLADVFSRHNFDCVFHVAALPRVQYSIAEPMVTHEANVNGVLNLLEFCRKFGIKRFVFSSSSSVYGNQDKLPLHEDMKPNPLSPYALHKLIGEHYCKLFNLLYGIETISLRYFNVYGPRQSPEGGYACLIPKFAKIFSEGKIPVINGDGEQTRDFNFVRDVVNANILAAETQNKECFGNHFNVGSGRNYSVNLITDLIRKNLMVDSDAIHGPAVIEPKNTLADISKIKKSLGWEPKVSFEEGLKSTIIAYKSLA